MFHYNMIAREKGKQRPLYTLSRNVFNGSQFFFPTPNRVRAAIFLGLLGNNRWHPTALGVSGMSFFFSCQIGERGFVFFMGLGFQLSRSKHFWWPWTNFGHHRQNGSGKIPITSALSGGGRKNFLNSLIIGPSWILLLFHDASKSILVRCCQHQKQIHLRFPVSISAMAEGGGQPGVSVRAKNLQYVKLEEQFKKWNSTFYFYSRNSV